MTGKFSQFPEKDALSVKTPKRHPSKLPLLILVLVLLIGTALGIKYYFSLPKDDSLRLSGQIEGYETDVGVKIGGRIEFITVREGDRLKEGEAIARLDDAELKAQLEGAKARLRAAQQVESQARLQIEVINSQIREAQLTLQKFQDDSTGRINQTEAIVAAAQAQLAQAQAQQKQAASELKLAQVEHERFQGLLVEGVISQQQFDQTQTRLDTAQATLEASRAGVMAAQKQVNVAEGGLVQAQTSSLNPDIQIARLEGLTKQLSQAQAQLAIAQAEIANAQAVRQEIAARLKDLEIVSPIDGIVLTRTSEPGEVVAPGNILMTLIDLDRVYLRGYIPEGRIGEVRVGQPAKVYLDSAPHRPLKARVSAVDSEASFTPENIYFREDRVTQVFGLKLTIENPAGFAKPGMPADGEIITK
jgi:HlyD family secretion protein